MSAVPNFDDELLSLLLRLKRFSAEVSLTNPALTHEDDMPFYRVFWACSDEVLDLAQYLVSHAHETAAMLTSVQQEHLGFIRGRLDAARTVARQGSSGNKALFVCHEAVRSFVTPQNYLLVWVIEEARRLAKEFVALVGNDSSYFARFNRPLALLEAASKNTIVKTATAQITLTRRPTAQALTQALRGRNRLYQLAAAAYATLVAIEQGDKVQLRTLLTKTLLGPLEQWRKFELFTAITVAESLARVSTQRCRLSPSLLKDGCVASVGTYAICWQTTTDQFVEPALEPSELKTKQILEGMNLRLGWDRPDLVILDTKSSRVVSVVEVKYFEGSANDGKGPIRDAVEQIVRYARGYRVESEWDSLLTHCLIVPFYSSLGALLHVKTGVPCVLDYTALRNDSLLDQWALALFTDPPVCSPSTAVQN